MMTAMVRGLFGLALAAAAILAMAAPGAAQEAPSGTVEISTSTAAIVFGANRGDGVLTLQDGTKHKFSVENLKAGAVGVSTVEATGTVYNLKQLRDFEGDYLEGEAGVAIGVGVSGMTLKNEKGVVIKLQATQLGVNFTLGFGGMYVRVKSHLF
jgi:hypothetical protein